MCFCFSDKFLLVVSYKLLDIKLSSKLQTKMCGFCFTIKLYLEFLLVSRKAVRMEKLQHTRFPKIQS